jgi:hypothetical protein
MNEMITIKGRPAVRSSNLLCGAAPQLLTAVLRLYRFATRWKIGKIAS